MPVTRSALTSLMVAGAFVTGLSAQAPRPPESLLSKMLRIAGLTAAPAQMRGPADDVAIGNIWIVDVEGGAARALTTDGGYRSPIFAPNDAAVLALRANTIVRLGSPGARSAQMKNAPGVVKLVGVDPSSPAEVVVLLQTPRAGSPLATVSLQSGKVTVLPFDASSEPQRRVLAQIRAQERTYGDATVYTKTETKPGFSRSIEWVDVYFRRADAQPQNLTACDGVNCVQPALSPDGRRVAFVKTED